MSEPRVLEVVYVAVPSFGVFTPSYLSDVTHQLAYKPSQDFLATLAALHNEHPTCVFVSPSVQNYALLHHVKLGPTYDAWKDRCRLLLGSCDSVCVMTFPGWEKSAGVTDELMISRELALPIWMREPVKEGPLE